MATISNKHPFIKGVISKPINPKYETRQYITGSFGLFGGSIHTEYKEVMVSCDGYKKTEYCLKCGENREHDNHDLTIRVDRL